MAATSSITVDYLIIGAGAMGMAFADILVAESQASIAIVDRHSGPGGHWNVSYPFVRLHGPSGMYGVDSRPMPSDGGDRHTSNLASRHEILDYYDRIMHEVLLASDRVTYLPNHEHLYVEPGHTPVAYARSLISGEQTEITVRKRVVDASYLNITVPAMRRHNFVVEPSASVIPINELATLNDAPSRFTVVGAGKTGIDAILWLLNRDVDQDKITWVVPRDAWLINRDIEIRSWDVTPMFLLNECRSARELVSTLEQMTLFMRRDPASEPTAFRCATVSNEELAQLRKIEQVVQMGRVNRIDGKSIEFEDSSLTVEPGTLHVDCTADGLAQKPLTPLFSHQAVTLQPILKCSLPTSAGIAAHLECSNLDDDERNKLCPPVFNPSNASDLLPYFRERMVRLMQWSQSPHLYDWLRQSRLAAVLPGITQMDDPEVRAGVEVLTARLHDLNNDLALP